MKRTTVFIGAAVIVLGGATIVTIDAVTLFYRQHEENMTRGKSASELNVLKALKKSLDRRREQTGSAAALPSFRSTVNDQ